MNNIILFITTMLISIEIYADSALTPTHLKQIENARQTPHLRVYMSKKLTTYWSSIQFDDSQINDGNYTHAVNKENLKVVVDRKTKGLITGISYDFNSITVSFDSRCKDIECSYTFNFKDGVYDLLDIPKIKDYQIQKWESGTFFKGNPLAFSTIHLVFNAKKLMNVTESTHQSDGHN
tara:strand:- start:405 stop:938 length:534 start_codon:yes stop_codon:yes gene_type:complete